MTGGEWVPFGLSDAEREEWAVLVPGVPHWMREPLVGWLIDQLSETPNWVSARRCLAAQTHTRVSLQVASTSTRVRPATVAQTLRQISAVELLRLVDYRLGLAQASAVTSLDSSLASSRSLWTVGDRMGRRGLVERVPVGVRDAVEGVIASAGTAGEVLARAWAHVHGLTPNDSAAYADAVRAAEIAAIAVVQPHHATATLGSVLGQMKTDGDWRLPLREHADAPGPELVLTTIRTLWYGHRDRHGSADYSDVTHEEARTAVMLAATVVEWFASGVLARRPA